MAGSLTQFGIAKEVTYGTAVAPAKWFEIIKEDFKGNYPRLQAEALSSALVDRSDRFAITNKGAAGSVELEPLTKGFGDWLNYMMGAVATAGPTETVVYTHTATMASLYNKSLTVQVGRSQEDNVLKPWTYEGGKVTGFEFSNSVEQTLRCNIELDFEKESNPDSPTGAYVLGTPSLPTGAEVFSWQGATITVGGTEYNVNEASIKVDNAQNTDRWFLRKGSSKRQPVDDGKRKIEWSITTPYEDNTFWEKVSSATIAGSYAELRMKWEGLTLLGTTIYPTLELVIPVARFDEGAPTTSGPSMLEQSFSGVGLYNGTDSALSIIYKSSDVTVLS